MESRAWLRTALLACVAVLLLLNPHRVALAGKPADGPAVGADAGSPALWLHAPLSATHHTVATPRAKLRSHRGHPLKHTVVASAGCCQGLCLPRARPCESAALSTRPVSLLTRDAIHPRGP